MNYSDAFRSNQVNKMCTIYLEIDGQVCSNPINFKSVYSAESLDINALSIMGYCAGLPKGTYTAKVMVKNGAYSVGGYAGTVNVCEFTWADNSSYTLTAKEVLVN